jgi:organic hydroperoxide reductase OsmC/OhrA
VARAKRFEYSASVERDGRLLGRDDAPLELSEGWTPEHLLLAALGRCTLTSLDHHAKRAGVAARGSASASGVVTRREGDGRFAFVEIDCRLDVDLEPAPPAEELSELLGLAERDCFIGASLTAPPRYEWRVNGEAVERWPVDPRYTG